MSKRPMTDHPDAPATGSRAPAESGTTELLPCPFCGSEMGRGEITRNLIEGTPWYRVICRKCGVFTEGARTAADVIAAWNRRAASPSPAGGTSLSDTARLDWLSQYVQTEDQIGDLMIAGAFGSVSLVGTVGGDFDIDLGKGADLRAAIDAASGVRDRTGKNVGPANSVGESTPSTPSPSDSGDFATEDTLADLRAPRDRRWCVEHFSPIRAGAQQPPICERAFAHGLFPCKFDSGESATEEPLSIAERAMWTDPAAPNFVATCGVFQRYEATLRNVERQLADLRAQLAEATQRAEDFKEQLDLMAKHCRIVYYRPNGQYPVEHTRAAKKEMFDSIFSAIGMDHPDELRAARASVSPGRTDTNREKGDA